MPEYKDVNKSDMLKYLNMIEEWCLNVSTISLLLRYLQLLLLRMSTVYAILTFT